MKMKPKILFLDIETRPALAYVWRLFDENIGLEQLIEPSNILSVGWKWKGGAKVEYADVWPVRSKRARLHMLRRIHKALSEAGAVVTFNGAQFDLPKLVGEFAVAGLAPTPPIAHIDTIKTTKQMGFTSNKLAHVLPMLGCGLKLDPGGFKLWRKYMAGDTSARASMKKYNAGDVRGLERLYNRILPYITNHAHIGERGECPNCGGRRLQHRGYRYTRQFKIERLQCLGCGGWPDGKRSKI